MEEAVLLAFPFAVAKLPFLVNGVALVCRCMCGTLFRGLWIVMKYIQGCLRILSRKVINLCFE